MKKVYFSLSIFSLFVSGSAFGMESPLTIDKEVYDYYSVEMSSNHKFHIIAPANFSVEEKDLIQKICLGTKQNDFYKIKKSDFAIVKSIMKKKDKLLIEFDAEKKHFAESREVKNDSGVSVQVTPMSLMRVRPEYDGTVVDIVADYFLFGLLRITSFIAHYKLLNMAKPVISHYIMDNTWQNYLIKNGLMGIGTLGMGLLDMNLSSRMIIPYIEICNSYGKTMKDNFEKIDNIPIQYKTYALSAFSIKLFIDASYNKSSYFLLFLSVFNVLTEVFNDMKALAGQDYSIEKLREQKRESTYYGRYMAGGIALSCCALIYCCLRK